MSIDPGVLTAVNPNQNRKREKLLCCARTCGTQWTLGKRSALGEVTMTAGRRPRPAASRSSCSTASGAQRTGGSAPGTVPRK